MEERENKTDFSCPCCLRDNLIPNEDLEVNVQCYYCNSVFGVINVVESIIGITCSEFKEAELIKGEPMEESVGLL